MNEFLVFMRTAVTGWELGLRKAAVFSPFSPRSRATSMLELGQLANVCCLNIVVGKIF